MSSRNFPRAAFTLIEMLVVVVIISFLSGMLLVLINVANTAAKKASTRTVLHKIETCLRSFKADFGAYPYQLAYPASDSGPWTNKLYFHLGTALSDADRTLVLADMATAAANYTYDCSPPKTANHWLPNPSSQFFYNIAWQDTDDWENPTGNPHQFLRADTHQEGGDMGMSTNTDPRLNRIGHAAVLNRMAAERARLLLLTGDITAGGVKQPAVPSGPFAQPAKDRSGFRLVANPVSNPQHPGWAVDYLQGEMEPRFINGDTVLDAYRRPLIYVCQVQMGVRSTETMLFHVFQDVPHPEYYGLATVGRKTLSTLDAPDPTGGLPDPNDLMASDITTYAAPGFETEFELWSAGQDGRFAHLRNDPANLDNIPCDSYNKGLR